MIGFVLFVITLVINLIASAIVNRSRSGAGWTCDAAGRTCRRRRRAFSSPLVGIDGNGVTGARTRPSEARDRSSVPGSPPEVPARPEAAAHPDPAQRRRVPTTSAARRRRRLVVLAWCGWSSTS